MPHSGHFLGKSNFGRSPFRSVDLDADDVRNDLARLLHHHHVAHADVLALDFLGVVQARPADDRAGQFDRFQVGDGRDRAGLAHLHADGVDAGRGLVFLELVGDDPPRGLRRGPQPLPLVVAVHLEHQPVDLEIEFVQPLDELLAMLGGRLEAGKAGHAGRDGDAVVGHLLEEIHMRWASSPSRSPTEWQKNRSRRSAQIRGSNWRMLPAATFRVLANSGLPSAFCRSLSRTRSLLVM